MYSKFSHYINIVISIVMSKWRFPRWTSWCTVYFLMWLAVWPSMIPWSWSLGSLSVLQGGPPFFGWFPRYVAWWNSRNIIFGQTLVVLFFLGYACQLLLILTRFGRWGSHTFFTFVPTFYLMTFDFAVEAPDWLRQIMACHRQVAVAPAIRCHVGTSCCGWSPAFF